MNILIIHQHYFPEMSGTARRAKELAESFVKQGYSVTVITSYPRDFRSIPGESFKSIEKIAGVNVIRVNNIIDYLEAPDESELNGTGCRMSSLLPILRPLQSYNPECPLDYKGSSPWSQIETEHAGPLE